MRCLYNTSAMISPAPFHPYTGPATACQQDNPSKQGNPSSIPSLLNRKPKYWLGHTYTCMPANTHSNPTKKTQIETVGRWKEGLLLLKPSKDATSIKWLETITRSLMWTLSAAAKINLVFCSLNLMAPLEATPHKIKLLDLLCWGPSLKPSFGQPNAESKCAFLVLAFKSQFT